MSGGVRFKLSDCSPELRRRLEASLARQWSKDGGRLGATVGNAPGAIQAPARAIRREPKGPNKTEIRFNREILAWKGRFEAISLRLPGGSRYTPDWVVVDEGRVMLFEVKSYRFPSEGRALTAFREARAAFPEFYFGWWVLGESGWVEKHKDEWVKGEIIVPQVAAEIIRAMMQADRYTANPVVRGAAKPRTSPPRCSASGSDLKK